MLKSDAQKIKYQQRLMVFLLLFLAISKVDAVAFTPADSKITVKVVGEAGSPVENADVGITFELPKGRNKFNTSRGFSDKEI